MHFYSAFGTEKLNGETHENTCSCVLLVHIFSTILTKCYLTDVSCFMRVCMIILFSSELLLFVIQCENFKKILISSNIIRLTWVPICERPCYTIRPDPSTSRILMASSPYPAHLILFRCCHCIQYELIGGSIRAKNCITYNV